MHVCKQRREEKCEACECNKAGGKSLATSNFSIDFACRKSEEKVALANSDEVMAGCCNQL